MTGVIAHVPNPTTEHAVALATGAELAGARWIGFADAFWWRDVWMLLAAVAGETESIEIGPAMTNAYMRHPFQTASALATLHELAPRRVFCGVAAGGSEVTAAAQIPRVDAPERSRELVNLLRHLEAGEPLDAASGRTLDIAMPTTPVLMAGRGDRMLEVEGEISDRVLLWAIPRSDLERTVAIISDAGAAAGRSPELIWAPLVRHADVSPTSLGHPAVYAALNTVASLRARWGLEEPVVADIRASLVRGDLADAIAMVPSAAVNDLVFDPSDSKSIIATARKLGVSEIAVPGFDPATVPAHLAWASSIEAAL